MKTIRDITHAYAEALDAESFPVWNEAQMLNGSFEGDTISQIGKKHQKKEKVAENPKEKPISDN